jgi:hypothetical protein
MESWAVDKAALEKDPPLVTMQGFDVKGLAPVRNKWPTNSALYHAAGMQP